MKWWIEHVRPGRQSEYHVVTTPEVVEDGFYRQITSISAFRRRELMRRFPMDKDCRPLWTHESAAKVEWCSVHTMDDAMSRWERDQEIAKRLEIPAPAELKPIAEHDSIWKFYKAIGYDYKKKRYEQ